MPKKYEPELKARAARLVLSQQKHYPTRSAAIGAVAASEGVGKETLRKWVRQVEVDQGLREGVTSDEAEENARLRRENRELREKVEILTAATTFFVGALDSRKR